MWLMQPQLYLAENKHVSASTLRVTQQTVFKLLNSVSPSKIFEYYYYIIIILI